MSDNASILQQLRENNPFASSSSPLPWGNINPDISQLNRNASEEIEQLIRHKRREPATPLAGLILGEQGIGKTHMLTRILRRLRKNSWPAIFVTVKAFTNSKRVIQELLSEFILSLTHIHSDGRSQFDVLLSEMMNAYHERRNNDGFTNITAIEPRIYLKRDMPELSKMFLKCVLLYLGTNDEAVKTEIIEWLREGLDDEDCLSLGLPARDVNSMTDEECESAAKNFLTSFGLIASYAHIPVIICFDEIDTMKGKAELVRAWGDVVGLLINNVSGILPLCFVKPAIWEDFIKALDVSILGRFRNNTIVMRNTCSAAQAHQLIHDRIALTFKDNPEEIYQWLISRMGNSIITGLSPRTVIELANHVINSTSTAAYEPEEIYKTIMNIYSNEYKKIQTEPETWPPNAEHLTLALEVWLKSHNDFIVSKGSGKYIKLHGVQNGRKFAFIVLTAKGHSTVSAGLKHGMAFMKEHPGSVCFYITEDKTHKKSWRQANENLRIFENSGGKAVMLTKDTRTSWYALTALLNKIDNGDVNIYVSSQPRLAKREDIQGFVKTLKLIENFGFVDIPAERKKEVIPAPPKQNDNHDDFTVQTLRSIIMSSPMQILGVDKTVELLSQRNIKITRNELLTFVKEHSDKFKTFLSKNDTLITLAEK